MAQIEWINADGVTVTGKVPDFAMESTAGEMKELLTTMNSSLKTVADKLNAQALRETKGQKETQEQHDEAMKAADDLKNGIEGMSNRDLDSAFAEKFLVGVVGAIESITVGVFGTLIGTATSLGRAFLSVGNELNDLTKVGAGFNDSLAEGGMSASDSLATLRRSGVDATKTLGQFSNVVQALGKSTFTELTRSFLDLTDSGAQLGMSLDDSVERMGEELKKRQLMGALDGISQAKIAAQIETSIKQQQKYSSALGVSTDKLVEFADSIITQTPILASALLRLGPELRNEVITGVTDFGTAMRALGGEEGGKIAMAMTEAAAGGSLGFSDAMVGYVQALPSLSAPMNRYINAIQTGSLSQTQANQMAVDLTDQLGNITAAERARVFALERQGDQHAASLARAILQFEQGAEKLKKMNASFNMSDVQVGTNTFNVALSEITGMIESFKYSFFAGLGDGSEELSKSMLAAKDTIFTAVGNLLNSLFGVETGFGFVTGEAKDLGKVFAEKLPMIIEKLAGWMESFINYIPTIVDTFRSIGSSLVTVGKVIGYIGIFGTAILALTSGVTIAALALKSMGSIGKLFGMGGGASEASKGSKGITGKIGGLAGGGLKGLTAAVPGILAVSAAILAIGTAIRIAGPGLEPFGEMVKTVLGGIGSVVESIGNGISSVIVGIADSISSVLTGIGTSVGSIITGIADSIATVITAVKGDQTAMLQLQTDQIKIVNEGILSLASIPSDNLFNTAKGIDAISVSMKSFADTVIGKEGGFFSDVGGWFTGDSVDSTSQFVESMNAFAAIDGEQIAMNAAAIINANRAQAGMTTSLDTSVVAARPIQRATQSAVVPPTHTAAQVANRADNSMSNALPTAETATLDEILAQAKITNRLLRTGNKGVTDLANTL